MKEGWTTRKFSDIFDLQMGKTPSRDNSSYWGGTNTWVSIADMNCGKYIYDTKEHITNSAVSESGIYRVSKDTVIMSFKLSIGKTAIATKDLYTNEAIMSFNTKEGFEILPDYIYYYLKGYKWQGMNKAVMGMTLNKKAISNNIFSYPNTLQQQHIVEELDLLSSIIEKKKAQLKELDNLAQSLFYEMFGDPITNEKGWEVKKLKEACTCITDGDHMPPPKVDKGIPFITISNIDKQNREIDFRDTFFVPQSYYDSINKERKAQIDDVLYTVTGSYGIPIIVKEDRNFCFQRHIALLRPNKHLVSPCYLCYWALCKSIKYLADDVATGIAQKTVGLSSLREFPIIIPPLSLQQQFACKIETIEHQKELIKQSIKEVETLFNSRMDYYFN